MRATEVIRRRRQRARRANTTGRRLGRLVGGLALAGLVALLFAPVAAVAGGAAGLLAFARDLPDPGALETLPHEPQRSNAATRLYAYGAPDAGGLRRPVLIDELVDPRRGGAGWVALDALPPEVVAAHLAALDPDFLTAEWPSPIVELALWRRTGQPPVIHSPITAALVGRHLRGGEPPAPGDTQRALQDWLLGRRIEARYSREQQLEWALNTAYYGHLAAGIEAAARVYFGKGAAELTTGEAALLAAVARDPAANPFDAPGPARRGRDGVLAALTAAGVLTAAEAGAARDEPLATAPPPGSGSVAPSFARLARRELEALLGPEALLAGGLQVETTLDLALQQQAACVAAEPRGSGGGPPCAVAGSLSGGEGAAVVVLDPSTGELLALSGDAEAARPLGTLVRPLIYLTALSQGYSAATLLLDVPTIYLRDGLPYSPDNDDGRFLGPLRLREASSSGRTVPATQALSWVGAGRVLTTARALGVEPPPGHAPDLTFAADGFPATLIDTARGLAATAGNGAITGVDAGSSSVDADSSSAAVDSHGANVEPLPRPATIRRVLDARGSELYAYEPASRETISAELAYLFTDMLAGDGADGRRVAVAGGASAEGDEWAFAYTPERLVGARALGGAADVAAVARALLDEALAGRPAAEWPRPVGLRSVEICAVSGLLPAWGGGCPTLAEWFIPGTEPAETDGMVREVAVNRETGRLATIFTPPQLIERRIYIDYPPAAQSWAAGAGVAPPPNEYDTVRRVPARVGAAELAVVPWSVIERGGSPWPVIGSAGGAEFAYYRLAYFPGLLPEAMQTLVPRGESPVEAGELGMWDTTLISDGLYTLLLTVVRTDGTFDEVAVPVIVGEEK